MELNVHAVNQMASGGSYVVIFNATLDLQADVGVAVTIETVDPPDAAPSDVKVGRQAIQRGVERVLRDRGQGASVCVHRLVINSTDLKPLRFEQFTALRLRELLEQGS